MNYFSLYLVFLKKFLRLARPIRAVFDCSNGTTGPVLKALFSKEKRVRATFVNARLDGRFPAHGPNPLAKGAMDALSRAVRRERADIGMIFDADGDRVFFVDDRGRTLSPDHAAVLLSDGYKGLVVLNIAMGYAVREFLKARKRRVVECRVGHSFVKEAMRTSRAAFGAEVSGHYFFKDFFYCDSGIFAAIQMFCRISQLKARNMRLSDWTDAMPKMYASGEVNFQVKDKAGILARLERKYKRFARRISHLDGLKMEFGPSTSSGQGSRHASYSVAPRSGAKEWWFLARPSNTEPLLRLIVEAKDKNVFETRLKEITHLIRQE